MAPESGIIASAVVLPDNQAPPPKRRKSSTSDSISKRPRLSHEGSAGSPEALRDSPQPIDESKNGSGDGQRGSIQERRKSSMQEEKKRGQRLFGGLLSTLSQSASNGQQKRRHEIEKRQQERAKQQKAEDEQQKKDTLANLKKIRIAEQIKFDEETMRTRHSNMLAMAHCLSTKSRPKLYYKPWELLPEQEDQIKRQITTAEDTIEQELTAFYSRYPSIKRPSPPPVEDTQAEKEANKTSEDTVGEAQVEPESTSLSVSNAVVDDDTTNTPVQAPSDEVVPDVHVTEDISTPTPVVEEVVDEQEHNGEVVLENGEDTVIY